MSPPKSADPVLHDRHVEMGLPSTDELLNQLEVLEPRVQHAVVRAIAAFLLCDLPIVAVADVLLSRWAEVGTHALLLVIAISVVVVFGWLSIKSKTSLVSLLEDRASLRRRIDARLDEPLNADP